MGEMKEIKERKEVLQQQKGLKHPVQRLVLNIRGERIWQ